MKTPLTLNEVINKVKEIPSDMTLKIEYFSVPKCLKAFSDHKITKTTSIIGKVGLDYAMLESVQKRNADPNYVAKKRVTDTTWIVNKKIQHNNKTGSDLLVFYPSAAQASTTVITHTDNLGVDEVIDYDRMREFCGSAGQPKVQLDENGNEVYSEIMYINANNIYSIERVLE